MHRFRALLTPLFALFVSLAAVLPAAAQTPLHLGAHRERVTALGFSFDGATLASADACGEIITWNTAEGTIESVLAGHPVVIESVALSTHAERVATGGADGNVRLFNATTGDRTFTGEGNAGAVHSVAFSPDGTALASAAGVFSRQGEVVLWDGTSGEEDDVLDHHRRAAYVVAWADDGSLLASGGGRLLLPGEVLVYDPATLEVLYDLEHNDIIQALDFSPDGKYLAAGGREPVVYIWDLATGELAAKLPRCRGEIIALAFTPGSDGLTTVTADGEVLVWNLAEGEIRGSLCARRQEITVAAFSADGGQLAFAGESGQIQLWQVEQLARWNMVSGCPCAACGDVPCTQPNIILIVADEIGYGEFGSYGQAQIETPNLDAMAAAGLRLTNYYAGAPTGSASRCTLMTGLNTGHCRIRGNEPEVPLAPGDLTVAEILRTAGYETGAMGKWSLGNEGTTGVPNLQGFEDFYGYLSRSDAENYYPEYLWRNMQQETLPGNENGGEEVYSHDRIAEETLRFVEENQNEPFFLYVPYSIVHANNDIGANGMQVPSDEPYSDENWSQAEKNYAAMITRMDRDIGRLMERLQDLQIDEHTIVFVTSDNGPHDEGGADPEFFNSTGGLRGMKGDLHEGGIRVPMIIYWPGHIQGGRVSGEHLAHWDFLPTAAEITGAQLLPGQTDGRSYAALVADEGPSVLGRDEPLYWETHEPRFAQAVRVGSWKAIRHGGPGGEMELYNLRLDPTESENVASEHPETVAAAAEIMDREHTPSADWPAPRE